MTFRSIRRFFYEIHLWLGIVSGLLLFAICLSGTILVFHEEIRRISEPAKYYVDVPAGHEPIPVDEMIAKAESAKPAMKVSGITIYEQANRTVRVLLIAPEHGGVWHHGSGSAVYMNPYTGEIVGDGISGVDLFFLSMMLLHRFLWLPVWIGRPVVGITTIVFVVIYISGVVLWLPGTLKAFSMWKAWKIGFLVRFKRGLWLLIYDLHNTVGFYLLIPSLILALTGLCWSFAWYRDAGSYLLGDRIFNVVLQQPQKIEPVEDSAVPLPVGEMIAKQNQLTPGSGDISVTIPQNKESAMVIQKGRTGFFASSIKDKTQWDRYRGTVIPVERYGKMVEVERFADKPFGAKIAASVQGLHLGNITGMSSKIFFFVVCLFLTSFPLSGIALWIKKLRRKRKPKMTAPS
jgi:uncharacterized iron-regulated membrane protein